MKKELKVVPSMFWLIGSIVLIISLYSIFIFSYAYPPARPDEIFDHILLIFCTGVLPTVIFVTAIPRGIFSVVTISERGVRRTLFMGRFKLEMSWEEMAEMRYYPRLLPFVFFSKTCTLDGMYYDKIIKRRDVIQVTLTKKVLQAIRQNTTREIINLPESYNEQ